MRTAWKILKVLIVVVIAVPAVGFLLLMWSIENPNTGPNSFAAQQSRARVACMGAIRDGLRDPSSAQWIGQANWPAGRTEGGTIVVTATYSATNAFGGRVQEQRRCEVRVAEGGTGAVIAME